MISFAIAVVIATPAADQAAVKGLQSVTTRAYVLRGTVYYDANKAAALGLLVAGASLKLATEHLNPFDSNAVVVSIAGTHEKLGYLSRTIAPEIADALHKRRVKSARIRKVEFQDGRRVSYPKITIAIGWIAD